jgi:uncharacterized radical SAM superfamily Fe-S cluster-containing enzyme
MCGAGVLCCIPMAMPQGHLVAFCSDLGISCLRRSIEQRQNYEAVR